MHKDCYEFQIFLDKAELKKFEVIKHEFPIELQNLYDYERSLNDKTNLSIRVDNLRAFEAVKKLLLFKKKPNRKPFSKETAIYGKCGHRCDLCVHFIENTDEYRDFQIQHLDAVYGGNLDWSMQCTGCEECCCRDNELCDPAQCLLQNQLVNCFDCQKYPCEQATVGYKQLEHKNISADNVTWAILPYVPYQYE